MLNQYVGQYYYRWFINPIACLLHRYGKLTPNQTTFINGLFGLSVAPLLFYKFRLLAAIAIVISGVLDSVDGEIARISGQESHFGRVLDIVMDRVVESAVIIGLFALAPTIEHAYLALGVLAAILICVTSFLIVGSHIAESSEQKFKYTPGLIERPESGLFALLVIAFPQWMGIFAILYITLVLLTAVLRVSQMSKYDLLVNSR